jgi:hypothetical protein
MKLRERDDLFHLIWEEQKRELLNFPVSAKILFQVFIAFRRQLQLIKT